MAAPMMRTGVRKFLVINSPLYQSVTSSFPIICSKRWVFRRRGDRIDSPEKTREFIAILDKGERSFLLTELQSFENKLKASQRTIVTQRPTPKQLRKVAFSNAVPFIGFGFLDNAIMIIAGDYIDHSIGAVLGISVLAAAALGNLVSDIAGVGLAGYVEAFAVRVGVHPPDLSPQQVNMNATRYSASFGRAIGITIGCLLGMFPLLFLDTSDDDDNDDDDKVEASQSVEEKR
ncbi:transmembrane protein 65-like isoform X2 [Ptychodera flava]|uniref:transmembrane protein 65-like isoform X2 n=1 Tax=Ptychodera flava TaxID=63121 RepID=UPI003969F843